MANYSRPAFGGSLFKASRGSLVLEREQAAKDAEALEKREKAKARKRDKRAVGGLGCRWPEPHICRGGVEAAHLVDKSRGGANAAENLVSLCAWLHRRGPESIHGKQLKIEKETSAGADGPLSFWRKTLDGTFYLVKREIAPGIIERD